jgi:sodium transport system ATP-binding protein
MREAEKLCDTIAMIHRGRILAEGTLAALRESTGLTDLEDIFVKVAEEDHEVSEHRHCLSQRTA